MNPNCATKHKSNSYTALLLFPCRVNYGPLIHQQQTSAGSSRPYVTTHTDKQTRTPVRPLCKRANKKRLYKMHDLAGTPGFFNSNVIV